MKKLMSMSVALCLATALWGQSKQENFDFGWKFIEQDVKDAQLTSTDDSKWKNVDLPHDWDIFHAPDSTAPTGNGGGYFPGGTGWYRKQINDTKLKVDAGESIWLHFEGVYQNSEVYVNEKKVATHFYGYTPFKVNITPYIIKGVNTIAVKVDNSQQPNCRWYSGSGIYRHVWLEKYNANKMDDPQKLFVRTENIYGMSADGTHADSAAIHITYADKLNEIRILKDVELWSPDQPKLYDITVGELTVKHGVRSFSYDSQRGFLLNG